MIDASTRRSFIFSFSHFRMEALRGKTKGRGIRAYLISDLTDSLENGDLLAALLTHSGQFSAAGRQFLGALSVDFNGLSRSASVCSCSFHRHARAVVPEHLRCPGGFRFGQARSPPSAWVTGSSRERGVRRSLEGCFSPSWFFRIYISLFSGWVVDRSDKRRLLLRAQFIQFGVPTAMVSMLIVKPDWLRFETIVLLTLLSLHGGWTSGGRLREPYTPVRRQGAAAAFQRRAAAADHEQYDELLVDEYRSMAFSPIAWV